MSNPGDSPERRAFCSLKKSGGEGRRYFGSSSSHVNGQVAGSSPALMETRDSSISITMTACSPDVSVSAVVKVVVTSHYTARVVGSIPALLGREDSLIGKILTISNN